MAKEALTYSKALKELETIQQSLEAGEVGIDELGEKLKRAKELMTFCREKLRQVEEETGDLQF